MPTIKPFRAIYPSQEYVNEVFLQIGQSHLLKTNKVLELSSHSSFHKLSSSSNQYSLRDSQQKKADKRTNENFDELIKQGIFIQDHEPALYIYQVAQKNIIQTGLWASTSIDDYHNNTIKKHELVQSKRVEAIIDHLHHTGVSTNPVLITYQPRPNIHAILLKTCSTKPTLYFSSGKNTTHSLWKIDQEEEIKRLVEFFASIPNTYLADGHHRAAAAYAFGVKQNQLNTHHTGKEAYNFFNTVYMSTDQLKIFEYNRLVKDLAGLSIQQFLEQISFHFIVEPLSHETNVFKPQKPHDFGMYLDKKWYKLATKPNIYQRFNLINSLDTSIIQDHLFAKVLHITDPTADPRLSFIGGANNTEPSIQQVDQGYYAAYFTLFPTSIEHLMQVADANKVMPPKSTWFEPKFQSGLMNYQVC